MIFDQGGLPAHFNCGQLIVDVVRNLRRSEPYCAMHYLSRVCWKIMVRWESLLCSSYTFALQLRRPLQTQQLSLCTLRRSERTSLSASLLKHCERRQMHTYLLWVTRPRRTRLDYAALQWRLNCASLMTSVGHVGTRVSSIQASRLATIFVYQIVN